MSANPFSKRAAVWLVGLSGVSLALGLFFMIFDPEAGQAQSAGTLEARLQKDRDALHGDLADCEALPEDSLADAVDLLVSIGGDGTMLTAARRVAG